MARPTLSKHRKFRELSLVLKSRALAWGSLELIWECGYDSGDPVIGSAAAVEVAADWRGKRGMLTEALVNTGFIDAATSESGDTVYAIHDLFDHMPEYVEKRMMREISRNTKGKTVSDMRSEAGKKGAEHRWQTDGKRMANGDHLPENEAAYKNGKRMANGGTRAPALALALPLTPAPSPAVATATLAEQRIAGDPSRTAEQPPEPMPPEAVEFFAAISKIGKSPTQREAPDPEARRELLDRQKAVILGGAGR